MDAPRTLVLVDSKSADKSPTYSPLPPAFSPSSSETPDTNKQKVSDPSFGTQFTETTLHMWDHSEAKGTCGRINTSGESSAKYVWCDGQVDIS